MKYFALLLLILPSVSLFSHEYNISHFVYEAADEKIKMVASIDLENLDVLLKDKIACEVDDKAECATRYLAANYMTIINGEKAEYNLDSSKVEDEMFNIYYHIDFNPAELYEVWVKTSFLLDLNETHSNDVVFDIAGNKQSVKLNEKKRVTQFYF